MKFRFLIYVAARTHTTKQTAFKFKKYFIYLNDSTKKYTNIIRSKMDQESSK